MKTIGVFKTSLKLFLVNIRVYIFVFLFAPLIFSFMYGSIYKNILNPSRTVPKFSVAYVDLDNSKESKPLESIFNKGSVSKVIAIDKLNDTSSLKDDLIAGKYTSAIVIPKNFSSNIENNKTATIKVLNSPSAGLNGEIVSDIVTSYCSYMNTNRSVYAVINKNSNTPLIAKDIFNKLLPVINKDLTSSHLTYTSLPKSKLLSSSEEFYSSMLIMSSLFIIITQAIAILKERELGTLGRIYSTSTNKLSYYFGRLLSTFVISASQISCFLLISIVALRVNFGNIYGLALIVIIHALIIAALTMLISAFFKSVALLSVLINPIIFLMSILSGTFYPSTYNTGSIRTLSHFTINYWLKALYSSNILQDNFISSISTICVILLLTVVIISIGAVKINYEY